MSAITIKSENDLRELGNSLDEIKYKRSDGRIRGNHRIEPIFCFAEDICKIVSEIELGSLDDKSSEELKNIFQIWNELIAAFANLQKQRKFYRRNRLKNYKKKEEYVQDLRNFIILAKKLAKKVNAKEFETSLNKALNDCNSIMKNDKNIKNKEKIGEIKDSENPFFELVETFKKLKKEADKHFGDLNKKIYEREYKIGCTMDIENAINYLETYGQWYKEGNDKSIKNSYNDELKKYNVDPTNAAYIIFQGVVHQKVLAEKLCEMISVCIKSPNQGNIRELRYRIEEAEKFGLYNFKGKYERLLNISKSVVNVIKSIIQKKKDIELRVNVKKTARMLEEKNILKIYSNNASSLCKQIESDVGKFNSALGCNLTEQKDEVARLIKTI